MAVQAHLSWGRWVGDCSNPNCTNAMDLAEGQTDFHCWIPSGVGVCGTTDTITWPDSVTAVEKAVGGKAPAQQNWRPGDAL